MAFALTPAALANAEQFGQPGDSTEQSRKTVPLPRLNAQQQRELDDKDAAVRKVVAKPGTSSLAKGSSTTFVSGSVNVYSILQEPQDTTYNCGPATLVSMVRSLGVPLSEAQAAADLGTTTSGTDWSNGTGSPMQNQLNRYFQPTFKYVPVALPYTPTQSNKDTFRNRMIANINNGYGIAGDAVEVYKGPHLNGHPDRPQTIYHWFVIEGYGDNGYQTHYADSVYGSPINWPVTTYNWIDTNKVVTIMGDRGYIW